PAVNCLFEDFVCLAKPLQFPLQTRFEVHRCGRRIIRYSKAVSTPKVKKGAPLPSFQATIQILTDL
ncbi:hypothetical protein, partial [Pseudomonas sp. UBA6562]|uniref:hypothetical protein n=1 Tax=Pseudomonas sp. UBA6562 TaxID=1947332 RepID=UPI0025CFE2CB